MPKANPFLLAPTLTPLEQNLYSLVLPINHCYGNSIGTGSSQITIERKNQNQNYLGRIILSSHSRPKNFRSISENKIILNFSDFIFGNYIYYVHVRGFAGVSALPLPTLPSCDNYLRSGGNCFRLPRPSVRPLRRCGPPSLWVPLMSLSGGPTSSEEPTKTVKCVIKGMVQGVFYRDWTVENATQLGLTGWVRNRRDGSVEALFSGKPEAVDEMQQRCRRGPPAAIVTGLQALPCKDDPGTGFERRPTV